MIKFFLYVLKSMNVVFLPGKIKERRYIFKGGFFFFPQADGLF